MQLHSLNQTVRFLVSEQAALSGRSEAYRDVGFSYFKGVGVEQDESKSFEWSALIMLALIAALRALLRALATLPCAHGYGNCVAVGARPGSRRQRTTAASRARRSSACCTREASCLPQCVFSMPQLRSGVCLVWARQLVSR